MVAAYMVTYGRDHIWSRMVTVADAADAAASYAADAALVDTSLAPDDSGEAEIEDN